MTLDEALWILDLAHTHTHEVLGYVVEWSARPELAGNPQYYVEAWGVVRDYNRRPAPNTEKEVTNGTGQD